MGSKSKNTQYSYLILLLIPLVSGAMHWRIFTTEILGAHQWRQSATQINIQNFYRHDFNILNPRTNSLNGSHDNYGNIMRLEFPIMQWLIAINHKIFGESITITRISMFLIGLWGVYGAFFMFKNIFHDTFLATIGAWIFNFSPIFYYYTMNPSPDVFALCSTMWSISFFFRFLNTEKWHNVFLSAAFLSLATLAKLPYIIFGSMVGMYVLTNFFRNSPRQNSFLLKIILIYGIFLIPAFTWYYWAIPTWGSGGVLKGVYDSAIPISKILEILNFNFYSLLPDLLLNYALVPFSIISFFFILKNKAFKKEKFWVCTAMFLTVIAYFFFEINIIDIIYNYYMIPFLPPLFILVVYSIREFFIFSISLKRITTIYLLLMTPLHAYLAAHKLWNIEISTFNYDLFIYKDELRKAVPQNEKCIILNDESICIFSYLIDKQGFIFWGDALPVGWIEDMVVNYGVKYMYSDSRKVDAQADFQPFIDSIMVERGSVKVFKLKMPQK